MIQSLADIKRHLQPAFNEQQTEVLATCFYESFEPLVTKREMADLRAVVAEVAESQKRLVAAQDRHEERMDEFRAAQQRSEQHMDEFRAAQQRTELRMDEFRAAQQRTELRMEEFTAAQQRTEQRLEEFTIAQQRTEQRMEEFTVAQQRTEQRMEDFTIAQQRNEERFEQFMATQTKMQADIDSLVHVTTEVVWGIGDLRKQVGGIARSVGQGLEAYAMDRIPKLLEERFGFVTTAAAPETLGPANDASEIDVVYRGTHEGRPVVVLCEVKTNISETEVREFLETVGRVRPHVDVSDVRTLFFCYRTSEAARRLIAEYGCLLAFPRGLQ